MLILKFIHTFKCLIHHIISNRNHHHHHYHHLESIKILYHFFYHDQCWTKFRMDEREFQEPQESDEERKREQASGIGDGVRRE